MAELDTQSEAGARDVSARYDLLLSKLAEAERDLELWDEPGRSSHVEEASGIVFDLLYSLDFRQGGEMVPRLAALYGYIANQLLQIGRTRNRADLIHLRDIITSLRQSSFGE